MACSKFFVASVLLLCGLALLGEIQTSTAVKCPDYCYDVDYVTCTSSGNAELPRKCNCCYLADDCTLHLKDGSIVVCP